MLGVPKKNRKAMAKGEHQAGGAGGVLVRAPFTPLYDTTYGQAVVADSLDVMRSLPAETIDLVMTSPPFALTRPKEYGNKEAHEYVAWFEPFALEVFRLLKPTGSFVIDIGGTWNKGLPTRSVYQYELLIRLAATFHVAQEFYWHNSTKLPTGWATRRIRAVDAVNAVWWLSKTAWPKADARRVLRPYCESMKRLIKGGRKPKRRHPSGHVISGNFCRDLGGFIPHNLLQITPLHSDRPYLKTCAARGLKPHPARFPRRLPEFFVKFLTDPGDMVLDPFAGSNVTGWVAEDLGRHWLAVELSAGYLETSKFRFGPQMSLV